MSTCRSGTDCLWVRVRTTRQVYLSVWTLEGVSILFTGQYRDTELANSALPSGLDYFMSRQMVSGLGRFLQPDPAERFVGDPGSPQSWHLYSYVWNNPLGKMKRAARDEDDVGRNESVRF